MEGAKPGHTVKFQGLEGAAHLNGTEGTLVKFLTNENRWSVRCDRNGSIVNAKPENLLLHRNYRPKQDKTPARTGPDTAGMKIKNASSWANLLPDKKDQHEWLCNCYQLRCDDDYVFGGCNLHGPYNPEATPEEIRHDFLIFCILAYAAKVVPEDWDWVAYLKTAAEYITFAYESSDAVERWGRESDKGLSGLRYTATLIYKDSPVEMDSKEHDMAEKQARQNKRQWEHTLGGQGAWKGLLQDIRKHRRFA